MFTPADLSRTELLLHTVHYTLSKITLVLSQASDRREQVSPNDPPS